MTDQITIPRALLEQAREALEYHTQQTRPIQKTEHAILALRTELAKPSAPAQHDAPEVAALKAERDVLLKDAERYRWLRDVWMDYKPAGYDGRNVGRFDLVLDYPVDNLDAAIDAAIAKAEGESA